MPRDRLYLLTIVDAHAAARRVLGSSSREEFLASEVLRHAIKSILLEVGEAAAAVSPELRMTHPEVPWRQVADFRNVLAHAYFSIRWETVWEAATIDLPALAEQARTILDAGDLSAGP